MTDTTVDVDAPEVAPVETTEPDWKAEAAKWKELARKNEARAKANADAATKFEEFRKSQMSEQDLAIAAARDEATNATRREFFGRLAEERFRGAALAAGVDPAVIEEDLGDRDISKLYDPETGELNTARIESAVKRLAPKRTAADLGQGARGVNRPSQLTRADLATMSADQIMQARAEGRLNDILGIK